jgi:hypothetical protein
MVVYDEKEGVWVFTGRVFSTSEQVTKFRNDYATIATFDEWISLRNLFLAYKKTIWKDDFEGSPEIEEAVTIAWNHVCRGGRRRGGVPVHLAGRGAGVGALF